jgi:hypothetical protein
MTNADHDANGLRPIPDSWGHSGFRRHIPVFKRQRQMRERKREEGSEDGGGRDKRVGSPRRLSPWGRSTFPGIFFGRFFAWLPRHA